MDTKKGFFWAAFFILIGLMVYHQLKIPAGPPGFVKLVPSDASLEMASRYRRYTVHSGKEPKKVPEGTYHITDISLYRDGYELSGSGDFGKLSPVLIKKDKTTVLDFGPPLSVKAEVTAYYQEVFIGMSIFGKSGERYSAAAKKYGFTLEAPKIKILDEKGNILNTGSFTFG